MQHRLHIGAGERVAGAEVCRVDDFADAIGDLISNARDATNTRDSRNQIICKRLIDRNLRTPKGLPICVTDCALRLLNTRFTDDISARRSNGGQRFAECSAVESVKTFCATAHDLITDHRKAGQPILNAFGHAPEDLADSLRDAPLIEQAPRRIGNPLHNPTARASNAAPRHPACQPEQAARRSAAQAPSFIGSACAITSPKREVSASHPRDLPKASTAKCHLGPYATANPAQNLPGEE